MTSRFGGYRALLALAVLAWCGTAEATTLVRASLDELTANNRDIVVGEVVGAESYWNTDGSFILTDVRVRPIEAIKGETLGAERGELTVTLMGGTVGETTVMIVAGATLEPGRSYVLFLDPEALPGAEQALTVGDHSQGVFDIVAGESGELRAVSQAVAHPLLPDRQGIADAPGGAEGFPLPALVDSIRQRIARDARQEVK